MFANRCSAYHSPSCEVIGPNEKQELALSESQPDFFARKSDSHKQATGWGSSWSSDCGFSVRAIGSVDITDA